MVSVLNKSIWVTFQKEGIHCYPEALEKPELEDVKFLGYPHRHIFHFKVEVPVTDSNREIEFIQFKRWCESLYNENILKLDNQSCEMIAETLASWVISKYRLNWAKVTVSEDGENGATVTMLPEIHFDQ